MLFIRPIDGDEGSERRLLFAARSQVDFGRDWRKEMEQQKQTVSVLPSS